MLDNDEVSNSRIANTIPSPKMETNLDSPESLTRETATLSKPGMPLRQSDLGALEDSGTTVLSNRSFADKETQRSNSTEITRGVYTLEPIPSLRDDVYLEVVLVHDVVQSAENGWLSMPENMQPLASQSRSRRSMSPAGSPARTYVSKQDSPLEQRQLQQAEEDVPNDSRAFDRYVDSRRSHLEMSGLDWLRVASMLRNDMPGVRVLAYSYKQPDFVDYSSPATYLSEVTKNLISLLTKRRLSERHNTVPIMFVGHGFGCIVLQRAIARLARQDDVKAILSLTAGTVFLDAPPQSLRELRRIDDPDFAQSQDTKNRWVMDWLGRRPAESGKGFDGKRLWDAFQIAADRNTISIVWFYDPKTLPRFTEINKVLFCKLDRPNELTEFGGLGDIDYARFVGQVKRCLLFKLSTSTLLVDQLRNFVDTPGVSINGRDSHGQTSLHWAARNQNRPAVELLTSRDRDLAKTFDKMGQTPLHTAVIEASRMGDLAEDDQRNWKAVIRQLTRDQIRVDVRDREGRSAWDYAQKDGRQWILKLRDDRGLITGLSKVPKQLDPIDKPINPRLQACKEMEVTLLEVFWDIGGGITDAKPGERFNHKQPSVFQLIYDDKETLETLLASSRPKYDVPLCRWIHLPANNEQWIHDLFVKLGIQDRSMTGQRHEGLRKHDRYLLPQAKIYKHVEFHQTLDEQRKHRSPTKTQAYRFEDSEPSAGESGQTTDPTQATTSIPTLKSDVAPFPIDEIRMTNGRVTSTADSQTSGVHSQPKLLLKKEIHEALVIFMPILGFERHRHRKYLTRAIEATHKDRQRKNEIETDLSVLDVRSYLTRAIDQMFKSRKIADESEVDLLVQGYLHSSSSRRLLPTHWRRTLDRFAYYMLNSTEHRDKDQVVYRWAKRHHKRIRAKDRPVLMVDQLWLWVLHNGNVVTSFSNTWDRNEPFNLINAISDEIQNEERPIIKSAEDLAHMIIRTSLDLFHQEGPLNSKFQECFQSSISDIANEHAHLFKKFTSVTESLDRTDTHGRQRKIESLFRLIDETELLANIMDIKDELTSVKLVLTQQEEVLKKLLRFYPKQEEDEKDASVNALLKLIEKLKTQAHEQDGPQVEEMRPEKQILEEKHVHWDDTAKPRSEEEVAFSREEDDQTPSMAASKGLLTNRELAIDNMDIVKSNIRIVTGMIDQAENVKNELNHLLDLKQKQANAWEARFAREGSEETRRQGNIMLVFTLVTIVFLPLSFMSSFFDLSIVNFPKDPKSGDTAWPLSEVSGYLFGISAAFFVPLIVLALRVNHILSWTKERAEKATLSKKDSDKEDYSSTTEDHDSDSEGSIKEDSDEEESNEEQSEENSSREDESELNPVILGRLTFLTRIPGLRRLWRYRYYTLDEDDNVFVWDYPLRHYPFRITEWINAKLVPWLMPSPRRERRPSRDSDAACISAGNADTDRPRRAWLRRRRSRPSSPQFSQNDPTGISPKKHVKQVTGSPSTPTQAPARTSLGLGSVLRFVRRRQQPETNDVENTVGGERIGKET